jgi:maltose alpha-D-glucosyltransferase/alpha-amylase
MVTPEERQWMWEQYAPEPRMRLNMGIRRRLAPLLDNDRRKIELANSFLFTLPGSPVLYYGDEIGMGDNIWLDDRNGVRTPMQWTNGVNAGYSSAPAEKLYTPVIDDDVFGPAQVNVEAQRADLGSLFHTVRRMIAIRKQHPAFGRGDFDWENLGSQAISAYTRHFQDETLLIINNLSDLPQVTVPPQTLSGTYQDAFTGNPFELNQSTTLEPYQYLWLVKKD